MTAASQSHPRLAKAFVANSERAAWHDRALWFVRAKRDKMAHSVPEWEALRETASGIKTHVISRLADYLEQFEKNAQARGVQVHWAADAAEHNQIVLDILQRHKVKRLVKSKSMLTEECHLNPFLEQHDIEVIDTDLGERIVQMRNEPPSHIVLPAIHLKKEDVSDTFHQQLGTRAGDSDPAYLTEAARGHLRDKFLAADAAVTGVNFAIAETGGFVVCTNEGNADLGASLPPVHIACMGIEKLIPKAADLGVFIRLLARSATGQPITTYTSHFHGPREGAELHIVLVDNGRSKILASPDFRRSLHCIRCGACMNTCPVYRRSGGHSYNATVPGPIGSILGPARDPKQHSSLPFACTLCGSCTDVCPVKIDLHHELLTIRSEIRRSGNLPLSKRMSMQAASTVLKRPWLYRLSGACARFFLRWSPRFLIYNPLNKWGKQRDLPRPSAPSFREQYRQKQARSSADKS
ncbi:lactate utilization protein B [Lignipirellula cremea]|uniref:Lactate utilization protein B n=1 Tax=Lignipirellula cremea TaxID=2528010 RepID=A0A518DRZ2_9BACT|nr:lactate utilization protein B [Lignipirellula cremea]QDU94602.1 Lactate utilization protein B [Lignipirellula cremea]